MTASRYTLHAVGSLGHGSTPGGNEAHPISADASVVHVAFRPLEVELKAEALAVVGDRGLQVLHDEERTDRDEISTRCFGVGPFVAVVVELMLSAPIVRILSLYTEECFSGTG
jgi:hypothetical protein